MLAANGAELIAQASVGPIECLLGDEAVRPTLFGRYRWAKMGIPSTNDRERAEMNLVEVVHRLRRVVCVKGQGMQDSIRAQYVVI